MGFWSKNRQPRRGDPRIELKKLQQEAAKLKEARKPQRPKKWWK